ncbi:MAG TPA: UDP-3-O-(3-hydroxymyristoyl)glucosamine N-acyltransferase, partial [Chitinophagales bacterium]|nr:UDP-3-O-(3-hydroxymyristoyl)glucosamine N-acyltransferase [Chitinophagales bacterium]
MQLTTQSIATFLNGKLEGSGIVVIESPAKIEEAQANHISFIANPKYEHFAKTTRAGALIVGRNLPKPAESKSVFIRVDDPYDGFSKVLNLFLQQAQQPSGIEQPSYVSMTARLGKNCYIGAFSYVGENVIIGNHAKIYPGVYLGGNVQVGDATVIYAGVNVYPNCVIGRQCIIHAGAVIGSDGFGFVPRPDGSFDKIPQTGNVVIEDNVEIGANTTIDRATLGSTLIRKGVKLDNLIQVGHNVEIGENTAIAAQTGISGSAKIGKNCLIAGQVGFVGHIIIPDGSRIG